MSDLRTYSVLDSCLTSVLQQFFFNLQTAPGRWSTTKDTPSNRPMTRQVIMELKEEVLEKDDSPTEDEDETKRPPGCWEP